VAFPFVLSPYLRPIRVAGREGFVLDDGVTGWIELDAPMQAVVRALWNGDEGGAAQRRLAEASAEHGHDGIKAAVDALRDKRVLFESLAACDEALDAVVDAATPASVPFIDQIELTNICPFRCQFCPRGVEGKLKRPLGKMELALFERLLDQLHPEQKNWRALELHHLGESLVHPEVDRFIAAASRRGLPTEMSCNPSMIQGDLGARLIDAGVRRIVISLDGVDNETLTSIRGPAARYDKAERNLDALLAHAAHHHDPPQIVIQMIDLEKNRHQRQGFLARWGRTGLPFVRAYIKDLDGPDPDTGKASTTPVSYLCSYPWRSVVVLWDGRVVPCCRDADAAVVLGDLNVQSLEEIWKGAEVKRLREQLRKKAVPCGHLCDGCSWSRDSFAKGVSARHPDAAKEEPLYW
jgi:radical SAM protein with 4Fe4S-binding SPASM domain